MINYSERKMRSTMLVYCLCGQECINYATASLKRSSSIIAVSRCATLHTLRFN